ncbi:hypothetical protein Tco_1075292, partial [Tanacetum coccineum]
MKYPPQPYSAAEPNLGGVIEWYQEPDIVMSDSEDSMVTYNAVSSPFANFPDIGSPGVDGPPVSASQYPPSPDFVPELVYPEFMPPEDESDPEEDPEEDDDEDHEENPADRGDDGDDEDESSDDDEDEEVDIEGDEEEEEEHPALVDS